MSEERFPEWPLPGRTTPATVKRTAKCVVYPTVPVVYPSAFHFSWLGCGVFLVLLPSQALQANPPPSKLFRLFTDHNNTSPGISHLFVARRSDSPSGKAAEAIASRAVWGHTVRRGMRGQHRQTGLQPVAVEQCEISGLGATTTCAMIHPIYGRSYQNRFRSKKTALGRTSSPHPPAFKPERRAMRRAPGGVPISECLWRLERSECNHTRRPAPLKIQFSS